MIHPHRQQMLSPKAERVYFLSNEEKLFKCVSIEALNYNKEHKLVAYHINSDFKRLRSSVNRWNDLPNGSKPVPNCTLSTDKLQVEDEPLRHSISEKQHVSIWAKNAIDELLESSPDKRATIGKIVYHD